jgi:hypothetical protein
MSGMPKPLDLQLQGHRVKVKEFKPMAGKLGHDGFFVPDLPKMCIAT